MKHVLLLLGLCCSLFITTTLLAQSNPKKPKSALSKKKNRQEHWEAGFLGGVAYYNGDLNGPDMKISNISPAGGLFVRYNFNDVLFTRTNLQFGNIKGQDNKFDDIARKARNFSFSSTFYDFGLLMEIEPFGKKRVVRTSESRFFISPYFHFGLSGVLSKPLVDFNEPNIISSQASIDTDKKNASFFHAAIPLGVGLRYDLNTNWMLGAEAGVRRVFSDYLDGISVSANPDRKDWFETASLVIGYRFAAFRDKDGDGIPNEQDACPLEPGTRKSRGCPDKDKDGIPDKTDYCPDLAGTAQTFGCPDADADGIVDKDDSCPNEYGTESLKGCPDKDGDGLIDKEDQCPDLKGNVANFGCPDTDSDSDGIPDYRDKCPEKAGVLSFDGCPDTSAIARLEKMRKDSLDKIAADIATLEASKNTNTKEVITKEPENNKKSDHLQPISFSVEIADIPQLTTRNNAKDRATILKPEDLKILQEAEEGLFFDQNKAVIKAKSFVHLNRIVDLMNRNPTYVLRIVGHTDNTGKELANVVLSVSRAHSVYDYLVDKGVSFKKLSFMGAGSTKPAADNSTPEGRAKNRRADIQIIDN